MVLINGAEGIGTGYSTGVPTHSLDDVTDACLSLTEADGDDEYLASACLSAAKALRPSVRGFTGRVSVDDDGSIVYSGTLTWTTDDSGCLVAHVTELPPGTRTNDVRTHLQSLSAVSEVVSHSNTTRWTCRCTSSPERQKLPDRAFRLQTRQNVRNMNLYDHVGRLVHYESVGEILLTHAKIRLKTYEKRLDHIVHTLFEKRELIVAKIDYASRVFEGSIDPLRTSRSELLDRLGKHAKQLLAMTCSDLTPDGASERKSSCKHSTTKFRVQEPQLRETRGNGTYRI